VEKTVKERHLSPRRVHLKLVQLMVLGGMHGPNCQPAPLPVEEEPKLGSGHVKETPPSAMEKGNRQSSAICLLALMLVSGLTGWNGAPAILRVEAVQLNAKETVLAKTAKPLNAQVIK
jgi:hypothetical protein